MQQLLAALRSGGPLPQQVWIPTALDQKFSALWQRSSAPPYHEWGVTIVELGGVLMGGVEVEGDANGVRFSPDALAQTGFVGTFHTHVYEDGTTGIAFSPEDFAEFINNRMAIAVVQSGEDRFLMGRQMTTTQERVDLDALKKQFYEQVAATQEEDDLRDVVMSFQRAVLAVNQVLCRQFGLCFYYGQGLALERVVGGDR